MNDAYKLIIVGGGGGYLSECVVYEIADDGRPVAQVTLPRMVLGSEFRVVDEGVLWRCAKGAVCRITPSRQTRGIGMGPWGKSDCIGRVAWYVQPIPEDAEEGRFGRKLKWWLESAKSGDPTAFDGKTFFRLPRGGYVKEKGDQKFHFPITQANLPGGKVTQMTLTVPYGGEITEPKTNRSSSDGKVYSYVPHLLAVTALEYQDGELKVTLGWDGGAATLAFGIGE